MMGITKISLLLLCMIFVKTWTLSEAENNCQTYKSHVLHSRRMLQDEQRNTTETELRVPGEGETANIVSTENADKSEAKAPPADTSEVNGDESLEKQKKKKKKKKGEKLATSTDGSSNTMVDEKEAGEMAESRSSEGNKDVEEPSTKEEPTQKETPNYNEKPNNETETNDTASDVELDVTASNLELDPEKKGEEDGKKESHDEAVLISESVDPTVESQSGIKSNDTELGEEKTPKNEEKDEKVKTIIDNDAMNITLEEGTELNNSTEAKEPKLETSEETDWDAKGAEKSTTPDQDVLPNATEESEQEEFKMPTQEPDIVIDSTISGNEDDDDEYGDFLQDFADVSSNFPDTAQKVADHLGPNIQKFTDKSKTYFNKANQQITESFSPLVGNQVAPFFGSLISYCLMLSPLAVVALMFEHIRAVLSLQKVLLFINIYLSAYFATLLFATFIIGEPMNFFYKSTTTGYIHLQLLQALGYIVYLTLQTFDLVSSCYSEQLLVKITVVLQWFVAATIGFHYYVTVFHRAMLSKGPHTNWKIYGTYSLAFLVLCLFTRIQRTKKAYSQVGNTDTDKKN